MSSSLIRSGAAALVATLAFAACAGGNGSIPSSGVSSAGTSYRAVPVAAAAGTNPCPIPVGWSFGGSCDPIAIATTGAKGKLAAYEGFTLTSVLATNNAKKGTFLIFQDATGKGDIGKYKGKKFPVLKGALLYLAALNTGKGFSFNGTPQITITSKTAIPGKSCVLNELSTKLQWGPTPITGTVKGKTVTFSSLPVAKTIPASTDGPFYLGFSCQ